MKRCPKCSCVLGERLQEGQEITCPECGLKTIIHYTLMDQLRDPVGLLLRDPKYISRKYLVIDPKPVSRKFQVGVICIVLLIVVLAIVFMLL